MNLAASQFLYLWSVHTKKLIKIDSESATKHFGLKMSFGDVTSCSNNLQNLQMLVRNVQEYQLLDLYRRRLNNSAHSNRITGTWRPFHWAAVNKYTELRFCWCFSQRRANERSQPWTRGKQNIHTNRPEQTKQNRFSPIDSVWPTDQNCSLGQFTVTKLSELFENVLRL